MSESLLDLPEMDEDNSPDLTSLWAPKVAWEYRVLRLPIHDAYSTEIKFLVAGAVSASVRSHQEEPHSSLKET